jgi:hypothetical protein
MAELNTRDIGSGHRDCRIRAEASKMLRSVKEIHGCTVVASDGDIGAVDEVYFDDVEWKIRYLVVETGSWLTERRVLISPHSVQHTERASNIHVHLTRQHVRDSPKVDTDKPVSRQHEIEYVNYYGYPRYWDGPDLVGLSSRPSFSLIEPARNLTSVAAQLSGLREAPPHDIHFRSTRAVEGYRIEAADGRIGEVSGFLFDDDAWAIRYVTFDTRKWWPGGKTVLLATQWIDDIDWTNSTISTTLTCDAIRHSPAYDDSVVLNRGDETMLHDYYRKNGYWTAAAQL